MADTQAVVEHMMTGQPLDPEVERRIHEQARAIRALSGGRRNWPAIRAAAERALRRRLSRKPGRRGVRVSHT